MTTKRTWCCNTNIHQPHTEGCNFTPKPEDGLKQVPPPEGWHITFIPGNGPFAGREITRTFVGGEGDLDWAKRHLYRLYGYDSKVLGQVRARGRGEVSGDYDKVLRAAKVPDVARQILEAVMIMHMRSHRNTCSECSVRGRESEYPCQTMRAITRAAGINE